MSRHTQLIREGEPVALAWDWFTLAALCQAAEAETGVSDFLSTDLGFGESGYTYQADHRCTSDEGDHLDVLAGDTFRWWWS